MARCYQLIGIPGAGGPQATGGNVSNLSGNSGFCSPTCGKAGGLAVTGVTSPSGGAGGPGDATAIGTPGSPGVVRFTWS